MSRFLARALANIEAEAPALPRPAEMLERPGTNFGGFGGFGGFGERAENENAPAPARFTWPDGVDYWLTKDATELAGILNMGGTSRWCGNGGLDVWRADGRYRGFSPDLVDRLRAAGLLPGGLPEKSLRWGWSCL